MPLAGHEADVLGVFADIGGYGLDRVVDAVPVLAVLGQPRADDRVQAAEGLLDEGHAQVAHVPEVPVERGGRDTHDAGDLAQAEAAQTLVLQQGQPGVQQRAAGPGLLEVSLRRVRGGGAHGVQ